MAQTKEQIFPEPTCCPDAVWDVRDYVSNSWANFSRNVVFLRMIQRLFSPYASDEASNTLTLLQDAFGVFCLLRRSRTTHSEESMTS